MNFKLTILTPAGRFFDGEAETMTVPGLVGSFGVLTRHAPMVAAMGRGVLVVKQELQTLFFAVDGGVTEVKPDGVVVLADRVAQGANALAAEQMVAAFSGNDNASTPVPAVKPAAH